jgi:PAS domain S-box-containing protein
MATTSEFQARPAQRSDAAGHMFELVTRALNVAYYEWLPGRDELHFSPALLELFGYEPGTWTQQRSWDAIHRDDQPGYRDARIAYLKGDAERAEFTYRARMANGEWRWLREQTTVERNAAGRVTRLVGAVSDITEARQSEADLQAANQALAGRDTANRALIASQAASIEVLKAISASPDDAQPVFELIARHARELCDAVAVVVIEYDGALLHLRALEGYDPAVADPLRDAFPRPPGPETMAGRVVLSGQTGHLRDVNADPGMYQIVRGLGIGTLLGVPMLRAGRVIGVILVARYQTGGFDDTQVALLQAFAEQAVIAIASAATLGELRTRTAELAARNSEFSEQIEQQAATIDVLKVMSASPGDARPVFDLIVARARAFCEAQQSAVALAVDGAIHLQSHTGLDRAYADDYANRFPRPIGTDTVFGRTILARDVVQIPDNTADPGYAMAANARLYGIRAHAGVPLLRGDTAIGALVLARSTPGQFSPAQIELLRTFAEQAVIAIGSAETYRELQERTTALARRNSEYGERVEHQSATIDVLRAMSASPADAQPVFDLIVEQATKVCNAPNAVLFRYDGGLLHWQATSGANTYASPEAFDAIRRRFPMAPNRALLVGRTVLDRRLWHVRDIDAEPELAQALHDLNTKSLLSVPLLRDGAVLGVLGISARERGGFSDTQVALLQTFADQAVIAIGSAETYRELQERTAALAQRNNEYSERIEQQSATIDVLKVMSSSPGDAQPVFELITRRALQFCGADGARLVELVDGLRHLRALARADGVETDADMALRRLYPAAPGQDSIDGRVILGGQIVHTRDVSETPTGMRGRYSASVLGVPLLRDSRVVGALVLSRSQPGGFGETQIELLRTFAEQAAIAITSAETYRALQERTAALALRNSEYGERIEHQSATIDVLKVMSASPGDTQPVFDQIVRRAQDLCNGMSVGLFEYDGKLMHIRASFGGDETANLRYAAMFPMAPTRRSLAGRAVLDRQIVHVRDMGEEPDLFQAVRDLGAGTTISLPLLRDDTAIGAISLNAKERGGFSDSQVELLQTFAEQAVIAITSVANFRALGERTAELTRSVAELQTLEEVLRAVNSSLDLDTVLATIISRAVQLSQADEGTIYEFDTAEQVFVPKATFGMSAERVEWLRDRKVRLGETHLGRAAVQRAPVHVEDVQQDLDLRDAGGVLRGIHAVLAVPLLWDDKVAGGLVIRRRTAGGFAPSIPALLQTFAGQAVLAIENAALFQQARRARTEAEHTLADLRRAQDRLVQSEKMASLGQLTAGIAHEIKNPLNFVNNFSELSVGLLDELHEAIATQRQVEIDELTATLKGNLERIAEHGGRADSIVKNMLLHSRTGPSEPRLINLNAAIEEALNLAYHGARAETPGFTVAIATQLDPHAGMIELYLQEFTRVMLNLIGNAFYAARTRARTATKGFEPAVRLTTRDLGDRVEVRVWDNGIGIDAELRDRIFEPFFTTKPAGEGTGLGLSLSYDIIVNQHGGQLTVDSRIDEFTEFRIILPRAPAAGRGVQR